MAAAHSPLLFDVDGTLVQSGELVIECFQDVLQEWGLAPVPTDQARLIVGPPLAVSFRMFTELGETDITQAIADYRARYVPRINEPPLYAGAADLLAELHAAGVPMATATSKQEHQAVTQMNHWGLTRYFAAVVGADPTPQSTKSTVVADALGRLAARGVDVSGAVMIGDRSHDVRGAADSGIPAIGAGWGYGAPEEFTDEHVLAVPQDVAELRELLLG